EQRLLDGVAEPDRVRQDEGRAYGVGPPGGGAADTAEAQAGLAGGAVVLEAVAFCEGVGGEVGAVGAGVVGPSAEAGGVVDQVEVGVCADRQANGRTTAGHGSPPRCAVYSKGESWPLPCLRLLDGRLPLLQAPQSAMIRNSLCRRSVGACI